MILCYHSVNPSPGYLSLSPELFDAHLAWLERHADVVSLGELVASRGARRPQVAITFDDGYADNHTHALPLLTARGMTATFFLTAGFLERDESVLAQLAETWHTPVGRAAPLSWAQVEEMRAGGHDVRLAHLEPPQPRADRRGRGRERADALAEGARGAAGRARLGGRLSLGQAAPARHRAHLRGGRGRPATGSASSRCRARCATRTAPLRIPRFGVGSEPVESLAGKVRGEIDWHGAVHERMPGFLAARCGPEDA